MKRARGRNAGECAHEKNGASGKRRRGVNPAAGGGSPHRET
jgi:hypothetical protein